MAAKAMYQKVGDEESVESLLENQNDIQPTLHSQTHYQRIIKSVSPKNWLNNKTTTTTTTNSNIKTNVKTHRFTTLVTLLLCLSIILNILAWSRNGMLKHGEEKVQIHELEYGKDLRYMSLHHKYDHLWNRIGSDHGGLIKYPEKGRSHPGRDAPLGVMSMFHQLHCVAALRNALQSGYYGMGIAFDQTENPHWPHCLDYLRKTILCVGDDTIERERVRNGTRTFKIDGLTDTRQCKDTTHIYDLLREKGLPDAKGPLGDVVDETGEWWINS